VAAINQLAAGRSNASGEITLTPSASTTTIDSNQNPNINENAQVILFPKTASAAAEQGSGTIFASVSRIAGVNTVTITHANSASADRTFAYIVIGG
jgi:hypothetical protein